MTESRGPLASPGYWLHHAALAWRAELAAGLRPLGLTPTQFDVLAALSWVSRTAPDPRQQAVADFAGIDRMMTSKVLTALVDRGLAQRVADPTDGRANRLRLTDAGRGTVDRATAVARAVDARAFVGAADLPAVRRVLEALVQRRRSASASQPGAGSPSRMRAADSPP